MDKEIREAYQQGFAFRMTTAMRVLHILFAVELTLLIITGLPLMFAGSGFGLALVNLMGGFEVRGFIHRFAAVVLALQTIYYLGYLLFSRVGRVELGDRWFKGADFRPLFGGSHAGIGKYSLGQKLHFWLAGIIVVTMIFSGLVLWFPTQAMSMFPPWLVHVFLIAHGYEGLLAFVVLVLWHLYAVHLSPRHFPMNPVWLTGRIPLEEAKEYHPLEYERIVKLVEKDER